MAVCENFTAGEENLNKCANCGEYVSAHLDLTATDD